MQCRWQQFALLHTNPWVSPQHCTSQAHDYNSSIRKVKTERTGCHYTVTSKSAWATRVPVSKMYQPQKFLDLLFLSGDTTSQTYYIVEASVEFIIPDNSQVWDYRCVPLCSANIGRSHVISMEIGNESQTTYCTSVYNSQQREATQTVHQLRAPQSGRHAEQLSIPEQHQHPDPNKTETGQKLILMIHNDPLQSILRG